jgi:hypothetical protein
VDAPLKAVAVARGAAQRGLAVAACVIRSSEDVAVGHRSRNAGTALPRTQGIVHVPAAQGAKGDQDRHQDAKEVFLLDYHFSDEPHLQSI